MGLSLPKQQQLLLQLEIVFWPCVVVYILYVRCVSKWNESTSVYVRQQRYTLKKVERKNKKKYRRNVRDSLYALWVIILNDRRRHKRHASCKGPPTEHTAGPQQSRHNVFIPFAYVSSYSFVLFFFYLYRRRNGGLSFSLQWWNRLLFCFLKFLPIYAV